jgi:predicted RNase H-like nuclease (RuvC/YqgF family)
MYSCYRWFARRSAAKEDEEPLIDEELERLYEQKLHLQNSISEEETKNEALKAEHVMLNEGADKDAVFGDIVERDYRIFLMKEKLRDIENSILVRL